ncbi:MAG: hypothetical protein QNJ46_36080 [Leptolyngbyaceae cyanobacterium MO_188.B28]|nr:hypothetical protein [Leptolyngbyaceae cyanobacterium MO_188.B28]
MLQPTTPYLDQAGRKKAVIYLHGFTLGPSKIYQRHLDHLVQQGFYVFYPIYQRLICTFSHNLLCTFIKVIGAIFDPCRIDTEKWVINAISSVNNAYADMKDLHDNVDFFLFGHSLGGLQALSWPYYSNECQTENSLQIAPQQILAADPIPTSNSNIPQPIRGLIQPLFKNIVRIDCTGRALKVPVGILHGASDHIVDLKNWIDNFHHINSQQKRLYVSTSDDHGYPSLSADHMQASINTNFFLPNWLSKLFLGGVGTEDNLNWRYIWFALDQVVRGQMLAHELNFCMGEWSDGVAVKPITYCYLSIDDLQDCLPSQTACDDNGHHD